MRLAAIVGFSRASPVLTVAVLAGLACGDPGSPADAPEGPVEHARALTCCDAADTCVGTCFQQCIADGGRPTTCKPSCEGDCGCRACAGGGGTPTCGSGQALCGTACVALSSDPANCGVCGHQCASGFTCLAGNCQQTLPQQCGRPVCDPLGRCTTTCCSKTVSDCTGLNGPRHCVFAGSVGGVPLLQCCDSSIFSGEVPWIQMCTVQSPGSLPTALAPTQGCDLCL